MARECRAADRRSARLTRSAASPFCARTWLTRHSVAERTSLRLPRAGTRPAPSAHGLTTGGSGPCPSFSIGFLGAAEACAGTARQAPAKRMMHFRRIDLPNGGA